MGRADFAVAYRATRIARGFLGSEMRRPVTVDIEAAAKACGWSPPKQADPFAGLRYRIRHAAGQARIAHSQGRRIPAWCASEAREAHREKAKARRWMSTTVHARLP